MDAFRLAAEMRRAQFNAIKTNVHDINVCKVKDLPSSENGGFGGDFDEDLGDYY